MAKIYRVYVNGVLIETNVPGKFAGWIKGKIFGRLDCKSGMRMKKENRIFFRDWDDAVQMNFRPCKICKPTRY